MGLASIPLKITVPKDIYGKSIKLVEGFLDFDAKYTEKTTSVGVHFSFIISISTERKN